MLRPAILAVAAAVLTGCGGAQTARLSGTLVDGGTPVASGGGSTLMLTFHLLNPDGTPEGKKFYSASVDGAGRFEVVASGGEMTPGVYRVVVQNLGGGTAATLDRYTRAFTFEKSRLTVEVKPGRNSLTVDLGKAAG